MKYIKLFEDMATYNSVNDMTQHLRNKLNSIGLNVNLNNSIQRIHENIYEAIIDLNINGVKNSILSILSQNILDEYVVSSTRQKFIDITLNSKVNFVIDNENVMNEDYLKYIIVKLDKKSADDAYITIMNNIVNSMNGVQNAIRIDKTSFNIRNSLTSTMAKLLVLFIKDNVYYDINSINISDAFVKMLFNIINYQENRDSIINTIKMYQPPVYNKLLSKYGEQISKSSEMGEMGFSD